MATVCVVIEHWTNEENYDDAAWGDRVLAVAGNPSTAENIVAGRKNELAKRARAFDARCYVDESYWHSEKWFDALYVKTEGFETPFDWEHDHIYALNQVAFYWKIEDHEIES